ncbi:phospholipid phosphatase 3-like isoform X1 [Zootermopsis nevadensis]|uniref:phospholipid phosphatase 3-like isoform X1 n=1 Tax=Zootermopsis nevadensis TaxID=136037 RepID=UPI000B8E3779|nr:phospholipid phosphatase 3-like isoform X1 [Zootermopsis nevadensis]
MKQKNIFYGNKLWWTFITSIISAGLLMIEYGLIPTIQTGFYCDDPKISYKFRGDTISITILLTFTFLAPLLGFWVIESCCYSVDDRGLSKSARQRSLTGAKQALYWYWQFFIGLVMVFVITEVAKVLVGEHRPHFLDTCRPDLVSNCTKTSNYIPSDYKCTNTDISAWLVRDSNKSFPSGHASLSTYTAVFMIWFIQRRVPKNITFALVPWLHCLCLMWAMICSFTRITDHRHHWWDVLAGFVMGAIMATFTVKSYCRGFFSHSCQSTAQTNKHDGLKENGHIGTSNGGNRHLSVRHLLSSTSSYTSSITPEDRELREVAMT